MDRREEVKTIVVLSRPKGEGLVSGLQELTHLFSRDRPLYPQEDGHRDVSGPINVPTLPN